MSSTNRGYDRHASDYYVTPPAAIKDFLATMLLDMQEGKVEDPLNIAQRPDKPVWFDPCAGGDAIHEMSYPKVLKELFDLDIMTLDIREDSRAYEKGNFLLYDYHGEWAPDIIITNPPFMDALPIIEKALHDVNENGYVIMLLRLNFFGTQRRFPFFQKHMPVAAYVHHERISFNGGATDSIEYMHALWIKGQKPDFTKLFVI